MSLLRLNFGYCIFINPSKGFMKVQRVANPLRIYEGLINPFVNPKKRDEYRVYELQKLALKDLSKGL